MEQSRTGNGVVGLVGLEVKRGHNTVFDGLVIPQILVGGLLMPRDHMPDALQAISDWLPLSYAVDAVNAVTAGDGGWELGKPLIVLVAVSLAALALAAVTLRRRTP